MLQPSVLRLIMDSLRYWVLDMHVDGFRFDLAATLARELHAVDRLSAFFDIIHQDPVISQVKLIAEPWDLGEGGYQVGNFPVLWAEWNGKYRDSIRRYWRGDQGQVGELAYRLTGSSDLYERTGRRPYASVNFVTAHDGFTLHDLVSYDRKHNEANGEGNRDGTDHNISWNCGAEGETDDPAIQSLRARQMRNFMTTLLVSQGVPMILHGDELGRTQRGNNNTYCQDNPLTWQPWDLTPEQREMLQWTQRLVQLRKQHAVLRRRHFFQGQPIHAGGRKDVHWLRPDGREMSEADWRNEQLRCLAVYESSSPTDLPDGAEPNVDQSLLLLLNAGTEQVNFRLPPPARHARWNLVLDTSYPNLAAPRRFRGGGRYELGPRSLAVLEYPPRTPA
jgi:isoamylase